MESFIKDQLVTYLHSKGLISKNQHAFIKKHSTVTNLLECTHDGQYLSIAVLMLMSSMFIFFVRLIV